MKNRKGDEKKEKEHLRGYKSWQCTWRSCVNTRRRYSMISRHAHTTTAVARVCIIRHAKHGKPITTVAVAWKRSSRARFIRTNTTAARAQRINARVHVRSRLLVRRNNNILSRVSFRVPATRSSYERSHPRCRHRRRRRPLRQQTADARLYASGRSVGTYYSDGTKNNSNGIGVRTGCARCAVVHPMARSFLNDFYV